VNHRILMTKLHYYGISIGFTILMKSKKAYNSVSRKILYNILPKFGIFKKLVRLIIMSSNETETKVWISKQCLIHFLFRMV
jgi:hypothetical protein